MSLQLNSYPKYRPSGIDWVGDVPGHWQTRRIKTVLSERVEKGFPDEPLLAATQAKGVVRKEQYENRTVLALNDLHLLKLVHVGDFVISLRSFQGGIEYAYERGIISPAYTVLYSIDGTVDEYLARLFKSGPFIENLSLHVTGIREGQNIDYSKLRVSHIPLPPLDEQTAIVRYLDRADDRVQRAISAKERLIELLTEQRQAIIHQAVTRGLDPNVRLKDSGVDWLGDVPEHWDVAALRHRYSQRLGKMLDSKRYTGLYALPYIRNIDVQWDWINVEDLPVIDISPDEYDRYTLQFEDLLVCEGGEVGRCAIWAEELPLCGYQKALHRLRPLDRQLDVPRFMYFVLHSAAHSKAFDDGQLSTISHLTGEKLRAHRFPFPCLEEQVAIVCHLDKVTANIDSSIDNAHRQIDLLREYRTRLIADVVTGQVDVRPAVREQVELPVS